MSKPRWFRALNAVALALFLSGLFVGVMGFASADDGVPEGLPASMRLPEPLVGDQGTYTVTKIRVAEDAIEILEPERVSYDFQWLAPEVQYDYHGQPRLVNRLETVPQQLSEEGELGPVAPPTYSFDVETGQLISYSYLQSDQTDDYHQASRQTMLVGPDALHVAPCGHRSAFHGAPLPLDGPVVPFRHCAWGHYWAETEVFRAVAEENLDGVDTIMLTTSGNPNYVHLWLSEDLPYPVKIAVQDPNEPSEYLVLRLASFARGTTPLAKSAGSTAILPPAPELSYAPLGPAGMPEGNIDHPFPLSEALHVAREHPDAGSLRAFLQEHPDAIVVHGNYYRYQLEQRLLRSWGFIYSDGGDSFTAMIEQETSPSTFLNVPLPGNDVQFTYSDDRYSAGEGPFMSRQEVEAFMPEGLPTVESMWRRWQTYATGEHGAQEPNAWLFWLNCMDDCQRFVPRFSAGYTDRIDRSATLNPVPVLPGMAAQSSWNQSRLHVLLDSLQEPSWTLGESATWTHDPSDERAGGEPVSLQSIQTRYEPRLWGFPPGYVAAGAGGAAALVAVVYLLWPSLKAMGFMGLFSRVHEPAVLLENPIRKELYQAVSEQPGIHFQALARQAGGGRGAVEHHLRKLQQAGLVSRVSDKGYACYFAKGTVDRRAMAAAPAIRAPAAQRLLAGICRAPGITATNASQAVGISASTVSYHLKRLENAGLLELRREGRTVYLHATPLAHKVLGKAGAGAPA